MLPRLRLKPPTIYYIHPLQPATPALYPAVPALSATRALSPTSAIRIACNSPPSRFYSSSTSPNTVTSAVSETPPPPPPPSRWVSDVRARIGKCIAFGCDPTQARQAASIMNILAKEWRVLSAGSEGFLSGGRRGLEGQQVVWGEMDSFGHVNNANYIRYAESSRVNWILHFGAQDPKHRREWAELMKPVSVGLIMKAITAEYKFPMTYPDTISAYHKLRSCPTSTDTSLILDCVIISHRHRRVAARTAEDVAIYDYREARKTTLPSFVLDVLQSTWQRQEEQIKWARERIWGLLKEVESLENETWNREGAIEDLGAAGNRKGT
ncbi:thioesterase-like superfamily-domain-containing protein [Xylariaceae sp. FL1651]|nr:thioesterase-like superfamily-domain-containing protein [Xylariaceae sp. FL1651]